MTDQHTERDVAGPTDPFDTDDADELATDSPAGPAVGDDQGGTKNRPSGPDYGASPLDDGSPGSQGEIEAGSEGDFGGPDPEEDRPNPS